MGKLFTVILVLMLAFTAFSGGQKEDVDSIELTICSSGSAVYEPVFEMFREKYPNVDIKWTGVDLATGAPITIDSLVAIGKPPSIYVDHASRTGAKMVPEYALELMPENPDDFVPGILEAYQRNGKQLGLPLSPQVIGMFVNKTLLESVGYEIPKDWTPDDFAEMCERVKARAPGKYGSVLFAANQSGCECLLGWFGMFGAKFFKDGDYSRTVIGSKEGLETWRFWKEMHNKGYIPKESAVLCDDEARELELMGKVAACGDYVWCSFDEEIASLVDQGALKEPFEYTFVNYPTVSGANPFLIPVNTAIVVNKTGNKQIDRVAAYLANLFVSKQFISHEVTVKQGIGVYSLRRSVTTENENSYWQLGKQLMTQSELFDVGLPLQQYSEIRASLYPELVALLTGKKSPEEACKAYADRINAILAK